MPDGRSRSARQSARPVLRAVLAALVVSALTVVGPASAAPEAGGVLSDGPAGEVPGASVLEEPLRSEYLAVNDRIAELREAVGSGSGHTALAALIEADGSTGAVSGTAGTAGTGELPEELRAAVLEGVVTPELGVAIGDLYRTVRQADRMLSEAGAPDVSSLRERLEADHSTVGGAAAVAVDADGSEPDPAAREAALLVASTLDRVLPVLRSAAPLGRAGTAVDGCDVVEELPYLCVGSDARNTYDEDVALLVDLGADDTYLNSAGGAPFFTETGRSVNVSVNVDAGGDDIYAGFARETVDLGSERRGWVGQGAASFNGAGILVDVAGDDRYVAATPPVTATQPNAATAAHGAGLFGGVGALFDLGGDDQYRAVAPDGVVRGDLVVQGASDLQSAGLLVDAGLGDDRYEADGGTVVHTSGSTDAPHYEVNAQGSASGPFAAALLSDDGGADRFTARASARNDRIEDDATSAQVPSVAVQAQGFAFSGHAFLLTGAGPTDYQVVSGGLGKARAISFGQGAGLFPTGPTHAVLDDAGGDDFYRLTTSQTLEREIVVDDSCQCDAAVAKVLGSDGGQLAGQGGAWQIGTGMLRDRGGDDTYVASAEQRVDVSLTDRLSKPSGSPTLTVRGFDSQNPIAVQGAAQGGSAMLLDVVGTDSYTVRSSNDALARVTVADPGRAPDGRGRPPGGSPEVTAYADGPGVVSAVQGAAFFQAQAAFVDLAGDGDRIHSSATSRVETRPDPDGAFHRPGLWTRAQGAGSGAQFAVLGQRPTVLSVPSRPACPATVDARRGFGTWTECPPDTSGDDPNHQSFGVPSLGAPSVGVAPGSTGATPSLRITDDTPSQAPSDPRVDPVPDPTVLPVGVELSGPDSMPLAGRTVHFTLQIECDASASVLLASCNLGDVWSLVWQVDATTDDAGIARARMPLLRTGLAPDRPWRVVATFDGEEGLHPRHAARDLTLTE